MGNEEVGMRVVVTGSAGLVGSSLMKNLSPQHEMIGYSKQEMDVTDLNKCLEILSQNPPELILHTAAYTNVDAAEDDPENTFVINAGGTKNIAFCCYILGIPMLYFSTDSVFDGTKRTPYLPEDTTNPLSIYAKSKLAGELAVKTHLKEYYILRTIWIYGKSRRNFITDAMDRMTISSNPTPDIPIIEQIATPTNVDDLCEAVRLLIETKKWGTYHFTNSGEASRTKVLDFLAEEFTHSGKCTTSLYPGAKAERPYYSILSLEKIESVLQWKSPDWKDSLKRFIDV